MLKFHDIRQGYVTSRTGLVKTDIGEILTPSRTLNAQELQSCEEVKNSGLVYPHFPLPHKIFSATISFREETLKALQKKDSETINSQEKRLGKILPSGSDIITTFTPHIPKSIKRDRNLIEALLDIQIRNEIDWMTFLTEAEEDIRQFERLFFAAEDYAESEGSKYAKLAPSIQMKMSEDKFQKKITFCIENMKSKTKIINLAYASPMYNYPNYSYIQEISSEREDVIFHLYDIERIWRTNSISSITSLMPLYGIDILTARGGKPIPLGVFKKTMKPARLLDRKTLGHLTSSEHVKLHGNQHYSKSPIMNGRTIDDFHKAFSKAGLLKKAIQANDAIDMQHEFASFSKSIVNERSKQYFAGKAYMKEPLKRFLKIDPHQESLLKR